MRQGFINVLSSSAEERRGLFETVASGSSDRRTSKEIPMPTGTAKILMITMAWHDYTWEWWNGRVRLHICLATGWAAESM
jgi:hypothetical protein